MWEPRNWNQLPAWVKKGANPKNLRIKKTFTKYHKGRHYSYKITYYIDNKGKERTKCWRKRRFHPKLSRSKSSNLLWAAFVVIFFGIMLYAGMSIPGEEIFNLPNSSEVGISEITETVDSFSEFEKSPKTQNYPYSFNGRESLSFTTYGELADHLAEEDHSYRSDPDQEVIMELLRNEYQDESLDPLIQKIRCFSSSPDEQAKIAISLVQHIPYNWEGLATTSSDFLYPYETLYWNRGVCCDKSILLAYFLDELGFDVVLFEWKGTHMAVGVRCHERYDFENTGYAFIETTRPTIITYVPDNYLGGFQITTSPHIIHVTDGGFGLDISREFTDAQELKRIDAIGSSVLDRYTYNKWLTISNRYDLQYDT
jgi:hypothetical protein